jgi:sulfite reductase (NADPH) flavoprotein alpha-component
MLSISPFYQAPWTSSNFSTAAYRIKDAPSAQEFFEKRFDPSQETSILEGSMSMTTSATPSSYSKNNPFLARLTENRLLSKEGSEKETRHFVIDLAGSDITYQPGYSIGIFAKNPESVVGELLSLLKLDGTSVITDAAGNRTSLHDTLSTNFTLNRVGKKFVKAVQEKLPAGEKKTSLGEICADEERLTAFIFTRDVIDVVLEYPEAHFTAEELVASLGRSVPRLYSIASSPAKVGTEVHLTVAVVRYTTHGREKKGLCSGYLADDAPLNESRLPVFMSVNKHFKLPEDTNTPVIMVGPGTGIAPFRAFLQQREVDGSKGRNWLFFGEQRRATDFLYEEEFDSYQKSGLLTKFDTAFSRDQEKKIYVQDRMRENGAELWAWLQEGAYFYVCGDAKRMAKDVNQTLIDIAQTHGGLSPEAATEYVNVTLAKTEKRYLKDVY